MSEFDKTEDKKIEKVLVRKAKQLKDRPNRNLYANVGIVAILGGIIVFPLLIGILLSMFTAIVVTRGIIKLLFVLSDGKANFFALKRGENFTSSVDTVEG